MVCVFSALIKEKVWQQGLMSSTVMLGALGPL